MKLSMTVAACGAFLALSSAPAAWADTTLYIDDVADNIGQVDITTHSVVAGSVHPTGLSLLTDIAFGAGGTLYGTTGTNLYSINPTTGAPTGLGAYGRVTDMNGLVGTGGTTLLGSSAQSTKVYSINPASPGTLTTYATSPQVSAGDLAFSGGALYESAFNGLALADELVDVTTASVVSVFHVGTPGGATLEAVYGLADDGTTLYAVDGTEVYSVNAADAVLTPLFDYSLNENGQSLGAAAGTAFIGEAAKVPEPATLAILATAIGGLGVLRRKRR